MNGHPALQQELPLCCHAHANATLRVRLNSPAEADLIAVTVTGMSKTPSLSRILERSSSVIPSSSGSSRLYIAVKSLPLRRFIWINRQRTWGPTNISTDRRGQEVLNAQLHITIRQDRAVIADHSHSCLLDIENAGARSRPTYKVTSV